MRPEQVFWSFLAIIILAAIPQYFSISGCLGDRQAVYDDYPRLYDLLFPSLMIACILLLLRQIWRVFLTPVAQRLVHKEEKKSVHLHALKVRQFIANSFKMLFFMGTFCYAFRVLNTSPWVHEALDTTDSPLAWAQTYWKNYPFQEVEPKLAFYYSLNLGYHIFILISLVIEAPLPDFWENTLQVVLAMVLMYFSYMANHLRLGAILMILHDFCDIFVCATKTFVDTSYTRVTITCCISLMTSWAYLRLWSFVRLILVPIFVQLKVIYLDPQAAVELARQSSLRFMEPGSEGATLDVMNLLAGWFGFLFFLLALLTLNIYWFTLMVMSIYHFYQSGQTSDFHVRLNEVDLKNRFQNKAD